jgi:hypothetical protein
MRSLTTSSAAIPADSPYVAIAPSSLSSNHTATSTTYPPVLLPHATALAIPSSNLPYPHSFFNLDEQPALLSSHTKRYITQAIQSSWADSTLKRYSGTIKQFILFCDNERVPEHLRFPADEFVLCAFAASSLGRHAGGTPRSRLSALKAWHTAHNVEWKGSARLKYILNGVHNSAPATSRRPPHPPINARMLTQLIDLLDLSVPLDAAIAACAATAFWGQCRLGELLPTTSSPAPPSHLPTRSDFKRSTRNPQSCFLHLPQTKTHRHGQDVVLVDQRPPVNPITLLKNHIRINNVHNDDYIFSYLAGDIHQSLSKNVFLRRCNLIWHTLGYPRATGHCFRIGGTTELLIAGTPPDVVKAMGRWSSESFLRYWRSLDALAPRHVRNLHTGRHRPTRR